MRLVGKSRGEPVQAKRAHWGGTVKKSKRTRRKRYKRTRRKKPKRTRRKKPKRRKMSKKKRRTRR